MKLYQKSVPGWLLECETRSDSPLTRKEAYDMMYMKTLNTQSDNMRSHIFFGPLFVAVLAASMMLMGIVVAF